MFNKAFPIIRISIPKPDPDPVAELNANPDPQHYNWNARTSLYLTWSGIVISDHVKKIWIWGSRSPVLAQVLTPLPNLTFWCTYKGRASRGALREVLGGGGAQLSAPPTDHLHHPQGDRLPAAPTSGSAMFKDIDNCSSKIVQSAPLHFQQLPRDLLRWMIDSM
jgi:hypothetical protein